LIKLLSAKSLLM